MKQSGAALALSRLDLKADFSFIFWPLSEMSGNSCSHPQLLLILKSDFGFVTTIISHVSLTDFEASRSTLASVSQRWCPSETQREEERRIQ